MTFKQHQKFLSPYKKYYQIIKNTQLTNRFFFQQAFAIQPPVFLVSKNTTRLFVSSLFVTNKVYHQKWNYKSNIIIQNFISLTNETQINILAKRQRFTSHSLKGILLVNFPEKEKNFLIKNLAAENKIALITQSASLLLKDSRNMDDLLGVDDPIQILFDRVKTCLPCICFINNLDRIGKQRYQQEHTSSYGLNRSISSLILENFRHHRVPEIINEKEKFDSFTITRSEKMSLFNNNGKKMTILKNLETKPPFLKSFSAFLSLKNKNKDAKHFSFWLTKKPRSIFLFQSALLQKNTTEKQEDCLKFLNGFKKDFKTFFTTRIRFNQKALSTPNGVFCFNKKSTRPYLHPELMKSREKNTRVFNNGYYHRLPFWLLALEKPGKNQFFPKSKIGISRVELFDFFYRHKNQYGSARTEKDRSTSLPLKVNPWLLQTVFSQTRSNENPSMFTKTKYNMSNFKTRLKNLPRISSKPLFKDYLSSSKQMNRFAASSLFKQAFPGSLNNQGTRPWFLNEKTRLLQRETHSLSRQGEFEIEKAHRVWSRDKTQWPNVLKATTAFRTFWAKNDFKHKPLNTKLTTLTNRRIQGRANLLPNVEKEFSKSNSLKITETEIIKRTALLKFLQILDGFHTTTNKKKWIPFPSLRVLLSLASRSSIISQVTVNEVIGWDSKNIKLNSPAGAELKTHDKSFLSALIELRTKNFLTPLIVKPKKPSHGVTRNLLKNKTWFSSKITKSKKLAWLSRRPEIQKYNIYGANMISKPRQEQSFLGDAFTKKIFQSFSFIKKVPKWELYLKNQPALKSLNLLCVWPSYTDDGVGSFSLNDGASYILPEYFQLLGHGPKLKKQGITLIASTNNLTTLDAALLRPGRFDTIINFADSFSSIHKRDDMVKHLPSFVQNEVLSRLEPSIREREMVDFSTPPFTSFKKKLIKNKIVLEKNTDFLFNNTILTPSFPLINMYKTIKNQFDPQMTHLDIPNKSIPIKTFIDVSILIQYKLWWSFKNGKPAWLELYQTSLIQKPKIPVSDSEKFKIFKPISIINIQVIFKSKTYINLIGGFIAIFRAICFRIYTMFQVKFLYVKTIMKSLDRNQTKFSHETFTNQNFDFVNRLGWEILISKAVVDFGCSLPFDKLNGKINSFRDAFVLSFPSDQSKVSTSVWPVGSIENTDPSSFLVGPSTRQITNEKVEALPKNYYSLYNSLDQYYKTKKPVQTLCNSEKKTVQSFTSNFGIKQDHVFLKFNRSLLFCIGDFDYKTYPLGEPSKKDFDFILKKTKLQEEEKQRFFSANPQNQTKNITQPQASDLIKHKTCRNLYFNKKKEKNAFFGSHPIASPGVKRQAEPESEFGYSFQSSDVTTAFFDLSSKIWKDNGKSHVMKKVNRNDVMLTKYNEIYKLKKIKVKQQSFFNSHPFTQFMLKRWPKITKPNKLKRHLKVSLASVFSDLENMDTSLFFNHKNEDRDICLPWKNQINTGLQIGKGLSKNYQFLKTYLNHDLNYQKHETTSSKENAGSFKANLKKPLHDSFSIQHEQNFSIDPNSWFSNFNLGSLYTQIYYNLYKAILLMPYLEKESLKTSETNNFFSTYESYLFKKLTRHSSLNIMCLQVNPTCLGFQIISSPISSVLKQTQPKREGQTEFDLKKSINISDLKNQTKKIDESFSYKSSTWKSWISNIDLLETKNRLKKIAKKCVINDCNNDLQSTRVFYAKNTAVFPAQIYWAGNACLRFERFHAKTNQPEINNNVILLKNLVSNEKKQRNLIERNKSSLESSKIYHFEPNVSLQTKQWGGTQLDTSFFLLIFYMMFFEKIKHKKIILNTIKIFMPYRSLIFSHFLLSQGKTYDFSYKNFEILVYNKFKNFLADF